MNKNMITQLGKRPGIRLIYSFVLIYGFLFFMLNPLYSQNTFGLYAPPGSISLNSSYEWAVEEVLEVEIEHEGDAILNWFLTLDRGQASDYTTRQANQGTDIIEYQVYKESSPYTNVIMFPSTTSSNVVSSSDFGTYAAATEIISFSFYFAVDSDQFLPAGTYNDTLVIGLYTGTPDGSFTQVESASVAVSIRMAELMDVYMDREPGVSSLDLTSPASEKLIAVTHERSNAALGYTVSIGSENFSDNQTGHSNPYMLHETSSEYIDYTLTYGGAAVSSWVAGSSLVTDYAGITDSGTTWEDKELRITYSAASTKPSGYYQDRLTITITAK